MWSSLGALALATSSQLVEADHVVLGEVIDALRREGRNGAGQLLQDARNRNAKDALAASEQVNDLIVGTALVHGGAIGDKGQLCQVIYATIAQGFNCQTDILQGNTSIQQALHDLEYQHILEGVQALGAGAARRADGRVDQVGASPIVQLAVGDAGYLASDGNAVAHLFVGSDVEKRFLYVGGFGLGVLVNAHVITPMGFVGSSKDQLKAKHIRPSSAACSTVKYNFRLLKPHCHH